MSTVDGPLQALVGAEYRALADLLGTLDPAGWDTPSLCEGWRVREVVAHMTMPVRYSEEDFMAELRECGFDFTRLSNLVAARDAGLPTADLVAQLRSDVMRGWTPGPDGGYAGALNHVVVHSLDVTVPLGRSGVTSDEAVRAVLDGLTAGAVHEYFGVDVGGLRLVAIDLDWSHGEGTPVRAPGRDLVLMLTGRRPIG